MTSPFDFINAINFTKQNLFEDPQVVKDYRKTKWIVNKGLSYFPDTVLYANEMNMHSSIPEDWQFSFLLNSIPKKKRFSKWADKETQSESLLLVKEYFGYSSQRAKEALDVLSEEQITMIKEKLYKGGK
jgi:hypothetical protein